MGFALDLATTLTPLSPGRYSCATSDIYWNVDNAYGGWALALTVEAIRSDPRCRGDLISINAIFPAAIVKGEVVIRVDRLVNRGRTDFWRVAIFKAADEADLLFSADVVMALRRTSELDFEAVMPVAPSPEEAKPVDFKRIGPKWLEHYDQRMVAGIPFGANQSPRSVTWIKESDGRPMDAKGLAALSDTMMPRTFFVTDRLRFSSTVSYTLSVFAQEADFQETGSDFMLIEADSDCIRHGSYDEHGKIWSRSGKLLAVTSQVAFFK